MSTDRITITLVRVTVGGVTRLYGRSASDRWNLLQYGITSLASSRNQSELKAARRAVGSDFVLTVSRTSQSVERPTSDELTSLGSAWVLVASQNRTFTHVPSVAV